MVAPTVATDVLVDLVIDKSAKGKTVSTSENRQTPAVHKTEGLLLVTEVGGVICAVLVTWGCANACDGDKIPRQSKAKHRVKTQDAHLADQEIGSFARAGCAFKCQIPVKSPGKPNTSRLYYLQPKFS